MAAHSLGQARRVRGLLAAAVLAAGTAIGLFVSGRLLAAPGVPQWVRQWLLGGALGLAVLAWVRPRPSRQALLGTALVAFAATLGTLPGLPVATNRLVTLGGTALILAATVRGADATTRLRLVAPGLVLVFLAANTWIVSQAPTIIVVDRVVAILGIGAAMIAGGAVLAQYYPRSLPHAYVHLVLALGLVLGVWVVLRPGSVGVAHIEVGRAAALGLVTSILAPGLWTWVRVPAIAVLALAAWASGSRQAVLAPVMAVVLVWGLDALRQALDRRGIEIDAARGVALILVVVLAFLVARPALAGVLGGRADEGFSYWVAGRQDDVFDVDALLNAGTTQARTERAFPAAVEAFREHPWTGIGLATRLETGVRAFPYPHNLVLELAAGAGLAGLAIAAGVVSMALVGAWHAVRRGDALTAGTVLLWLIVAQVSGNIDINRLLFLFTAYAWWAARTRGAWRG